MSNIIIECSECNSVYNRTTQLRPAPDQGQFKCECGYVVETWDGKAVPVYERIEGELAELLSQI